MMTKQGTRDDIILSQDNFTCYLMMLVNVSWTDYKYAVHVVVVGIKWKIDLLLFVDTRL